MTNSPYEEKNNTLKPYLSQLAVVALAVGTSIGWGSLVVTNNEYLANAGPIGSVLGVLIGALIMLVIAVNYAYMANAYPEAGGIYTYLKNVFGYDRAFLTSWFVSLTYMAMLWANATSLPLFARYFLGNIFRVGHMYTLFGYDVFFGEILLVFVFLGLFGFLCMKSRRWTARMIILTAAVFCVGITVCFLAAMVFAGQRGQAISPAYLPDSSALRQVLAIAFITPWAFVGFESVSHAAEEYKFPVKNLMKVFRLAILVTTLLYVFILLLSVTAYPPAYSSWFEYIRDLGNLSGIEGLPAFYVAYTCLGNTGVIILMLSLLGLVFSSLIGNMLSLSRLFYALAKEEVIPKQIAELNDRGIPERAIQLILAVSLPIPFFGRTSVGWIVDVTTIGAIVLYGAVSAAALRQARHNNDKKEIVTGTIGLCTMILFAVYTLVMSIAGIGGLSRESQLIFILWSILGLYYFRVVMIRDRARRFGKNITVWIVLTIMIFVLSMIWIGEECTENIAMNLIGLRNHYAPGLDITAAAEDAALLEYQHSMMRMIILSGVGVVAVFAVSLGAFMSNWIYVRRREEETSKELGTVKDIAFKDPLTGAKSKHAFLISETEYDESISEGRARDFAVVVCDVNGLKMINDTLGHKAGDDYIRQAFFMICDIFQHSPVYRIGGDEFVVIVSGRDYVIRKELVLALHDRSVKHIGSNGVVVSGGYSDYRPGEDQNFHEVFQRADELMYTEKKLLKGLGAVSREDAEKAAIPSIPVINGQEVLSVRRYILIVEDVDINLMLLGDMLQGNYDILYASDGVEALEQLKTYGDEIAIVLLDLQMPRMTGMEVLQVMQEEKEFMDIPVIVMTADQSAEVECLKYGAMDFIPKPYPSREIIQARVNRCIELSEKRNIIEHTERDSLTKLYSLSHFMNYVRMYDRHYTDMPMDAVVLDVNHFHMINERYGKQYGDSVLARIGSRVRTIAREIGGVACRSNADVFFLYCPHREDYEDLLARASEGLGGEDAANRVRLRMGIYANVDKSIEISRRFDYAKTAANTVKDGFRKAIGIYDNDMHESELYRVRLLEDFRSSLENGRFEVYFQPKYDVRPDKPVLSSAEALVRWNHPELGMISPASFIPLLEDNGLIPDLDRFVWKESLRRIREWKDRLGRSVPVSVNVSRIDLLVPDLSRWFQETLKQYDLSTQDLMLEITESAYTGESEQVISAARELRAMGFRIEMDDFGTGYSSLGMLASLPIDVLKLDMSFVRSAFGETRDVRMIELILDIASYLHVPAVAEGVETQEQMLALKEMGCDFIQGYYFSKPVPGDVFEDFLKDH